MRIGLTWALAAAVVSASIAAVGAEARVRHADDVIYVATDGRDDNPGTKDQPLASLTGARDAVRSLNQPGRQQDITVWIRGGNYSLQDTVRFEPEDSGGENTTITYAAYPGEVPIFSGGCEIRGWHVAESGKWEVELPEVSAGTWFFRQLFVNGHRRTPARDPNSGFFRVDATGPDDHTSFRFHQGDVRPFENLRRSPRVSARLVGLPRGRRRDRHPDEHDFAP